jgi:thiol-disulfide isomerase/thioredoxin
MRDMNTRILQVSTRYFPLLFFLFVLLSCESQIGSEEKKPGEGIWRGIIYMQGQELPFNFNITHEDDRLELELINGEERIRIDDIYISEDSITIPMHIFDTKITGIFDRHFIEGIWEKNYLENYRLRIKASHQQSFRFSRNPAKTFQNINGRWEVYFLSGTDSSLAVGIFSQENNKLEGTFLKPTGDYRFLEGEIEEDSLRMSTFDGEHAYLFKARIFGKDTLRGTFWSGKSWMQSWIAFRNQEIELPDPDSLTFLKHGYERISFNLPAIDGSMVSLNDPKYKGKVIILQIFGTWCPNCMDETKFLSNWYNKNHQRGIEILAIAFERKDDIGYARERIERMKAKLNIRYDFVFGGRSDKNEAARVLPMLNSVVSFPTTIFIDREGKVRKIHTGFAGPGTGIHYEEFVEDFNLFMDKLLEE